MPQPFRFDLTRQGPLPRLERTADGKAIGRATTVTEAIVMHGGVAQAAADGCQALPEDQKNALFQFLKSLQVLPAGSTSRVVDENGQPRGWRGVQSKL